MQRKARFQHARRKSKSRSVAIGAHVVYEASREGAHELSRPAQAMAWSGLAAGLSVGIFIHHRGRADSAFAGPAVARADFAPGIQRRILDRSAGTSAIVHGKHADRTPPPFSAQKIRNACESCTIMERRTAGEYFRNVSVRVGHCSHGDFNPSVRTALMVIGQRVTGASFGNVFVPAIFAGWLIA